jgi:hypothetical protein
VSRPSEGPVNFPNIVPPYHRFSDFIDIKQSRFDVLMSLFDELKLPVYVVNMVNRRHIFVPSLSGMVGASGNKAITVLVAHYDSTVGSPGANDNGAAVFMLIEAALRLRGRVTDRWLIILTDKEELTFGEGLTDQGAYRLALCLKETYLESGDFFIFDSCGRGDTLVISKTADCLLKNEHGRMIAPLKNQFRQLQLRAVKAAENRFYGRFMLIPTPFSDDAGFLRAGLAAQTITVLPHKEATAFSATARSSKFYIESLISRQHRLRQGVKHIPQTWRMLNSPADTAERLEWKNFESVVQFAIELLAHQRKPASR